MVAVLSQYKLLCPAQECNESVPYENFAQHIETCQAMIKKSCSYCKKMFSKSDFQEHFSCFDELNNIGKADERNLKHIKKLKSDVEEARMTIERLKTVELVLEKKN